MTSAKRAPVLRLNSARQDHFSLEMLQSAENFKLLKEIAASVAGKPQTVKLLLESGSGGDTTPPAAVGRAGRQERPAGASKGGRQRQRISGDVPWRDYGCKRSKIGTEGGFSALSFELERSDRCYRLSRRIFLVVNI